MKKVLLLLVGLFLTGTIVNISAMEPDYSPRESITEPKNALKKRISQNTEILIESIKKLNPTNETPEDLKKTIANAVEEIYITLKIMNIVEPALNAQYSLTPADNQKEIGPSSKLPTIFDQCLTCIILYNKRTNDQIDPNKTTKIFEVLFAYLEKLLVTW